jgi:hypothetical protein
MSTTSFQRSQISATWLYMPLLFRLSVIPSSARDALFGRPFSSWQVASSSTSPTLDAAAPNVDMPPFALSGASPSLHARHEEQRFLFLLKSFEWLHRRHGHDKARREADRNSGILLREGKREIGLVAAGLACKLRQEDHNQFLSVECTCAAFGTDQIRPRLSKGGIAKEIPSCPWCEPVAVLNESFLSDAFAGREGQTPPFKGRAHAAPILCETTLLFPKFLL